MKKYSLKRFYKNIIHLFRYSIKEMYHNQLESRAALPGLVEILLHSFFTTHTNFINTPPFCRFGVLVNLFLTPPGGGGALPSKNMILGLHRVCVKSFFQMMRDC